MDSPPSPYISWASFYKALQSNFHFEDGPGVRYEGTLYDWHFLKQKVSEETGQPAPYDTSITSKSFDLEEGKLEIKYERDFDGKMWLRITGFFSPGKYLTGETWIMEAYDSQAATDRRFRTFEQQEAEYMVRHLLSTYSLSKDDY